jgi:hypothetical protein
MEFNSKIEKFDNHYGSQSPNGTDRLQYWVGNEICDAIGITQHLLKNRLVANEITALYGEPKVGKTHIAITCAIACVMGDEFWGVKFPPGGTVIYVAAERHEQAVQRIRAQFLHHGYEDIPPEFILVGGIPTVCFSNVTLIEQLKALVAKNSPILVIFDTYVRMTDNDEDKSRDADDNIQALTLIIRCSGVECAGIVVHHSGKDLSKGMRGSSAMLAAVTTVWKVAKKSKQKHLCLSMDDANCMAAPEPCFFEIITKLVPRRRLLEEDQEVGIAVPAENRTAQATREDQILEIIRGAGTTGTTIEQIRKEMNQIVGKCSVSTLRRDLKALVDVGVVTESRSGKQAIYRVTEKS